MNPKDHIIECPQCGFKITPTKVRKAVEPERCAADLLDGFYKGLQGPELLAYARRSLPKGRK